MFGLSLFGALTVQVLAAATGAGFAVCSACGRVFFHVGGSLRLAGGDIAERADAERQCAMPKLTIGLNCEDSAYAECAT